ncbi:hypothetical protein IV203_035666 [Nitzschia inconspicua]|uniref:Uncharacterized protein n=1 Tax=Nitzschia inconspicua TaxID=303405 RepID=A0A9K3PUW2_9STRA|nr:hypothetical protein IV203_035666 [Nitzschia inconspicua]
MQSGRGITNYQSDQPSHSLSGKTTEFDDQLLQRGVVTAQQVYLAKGASVEQAERLAQEWKDRHHKSPNNEIDTIRSSSPSWAAKESSQDDNNNDDVDDDDDDDSFLDDEEAEDEFLQRYRQERMEQLKEQLQQHSGIAHITRQEWMTAVTQASEHQWVLVTMVDGYCRDRVLQELHHFQRQQQDRYSLKLVTIDATDAIPNWPIERVPTLFAYHHGTKQHEWFANTPGEWPGSLSCLLQQEWKITI